MQPMFEEFWSLLTHKKGSKHLQIKNMTSTALNLIQRTYLTDLTDMPLQ
jgi:hypothetical protein